MSIKTRVFACAATLTLTGSLCTSALPWAAAATPQCGPHCIQVFSAKYGTPASPNFVESVLLGLPRAGVPTVLRAPSTSDHAGDLIVSAAGPVSMFYAAGMVSADVATNFPDAIAVQLQYAPEGQPTGLCAAVATVDPYQNEGLTLQPCQTPGATVFILDYKDSPLAPTYFVIVIGNTTDFVHPYVMTIEGDPGHLPLPQIQIEHLRGDSTPVPLNQLWGRNILN